MKKQSGITLIGLVITIIVLLILAGVSISMIIGENGILSQADKATAETRKASAKEEIELAWASVDSDYWNDWANNSSLKRADYYNANNLNKYLDGKGTVTYFSDKGNGIYEIRYKRDEDNETYSITIDSNGNVTSITSAHSSIKEAGAYDENGNLLSSWDDLVNKYGIDVTKDYSLSSNLTHLLESAGLSDVEEIIIPEEITSIGKYAFYGANNIKSVVLPESLKTIGDYAFASADNLTNINLPSNLERFGMQSFSSCKSLTDITIPAQTSWGLDAFSGCTGLTSVVIEEGRTAIPIQAFMGCSGLTSIGPVGSGASVEIPNSVTEIAWMAFSGTGLTYIELPVQITNIGEEAFSNCRKLENIRVLSGNTVYDSRDNCNAIINTSTNTLIVGCKNTSIPDSVTSIGSYAFYGQTEIATLTIPDTVTTIGSNAFYNIPNVNYNGTATGTPWGAKIINGYVESELVYTDSTKTTLVCPTSINLTTITIPDSVTQIAPKAFQNNKQLERVIIPSSVTSIANSTFSSCTNLTSIEIPSSATTIGDSAFSGCASLTNIKIPSSVTDIGFGAFAACVNLTSIEIPANVTNIGKRAFINCTGLTTVYFNHTTKPTFGDSCFNKSSGEKTTFYFKNSTVRSAFTTNYYNSSYGTKSTNYNW